MLTSTKSFITSCENEMGVVRHRKQYICYTTSSHDSHDTHFVGVAVVESRTSSLTWDEMSRAADSKLGRGVKSSRVHGNCEHME